MLDESLNEALCPAAAVAWTFLQAQAAEQVESDADEYFACVQALWNLGLIPMPGLYAIA